jgi:hypothetical protein
MAAHFIDAVPILSCIDDILSSTSLTARSLPSRKYIQKSLPAETKPSKSLDKKSSNSLILRVGVEVHPLLV